MSVPRPGAAAPHTNPSRPASYPRPAQRHGQAADGLDLAAALLSLAGSHPCAPDLPDPADPGVTLSAPGAPDPLREGPGGSHPRLVALAVRAHLRLAQEGRPGGTAVLLHAPASRGGREAVPHGHSGAWAARLRLLEAAEGEGPGIATLRTGEPVEGLSLEGPDVPWPRYARAARKAGVRTVHTVPLPAEGFPPPSGPDPRPRPDTAAPTPAAPVNGLPPTAAAPVNAPPPGERPQGVPPAAAGPAGVRPAETGPGEARSAGDLSAGDRPAGVLVVHLPDEGPLSPATRADLAALAGACATGLAHQAALRRVDELERALHSRVVIEQAKGVLAERRRGTVEDAFRTLRGYARAHRRPLHEVARDVVARRLVGPPFHRDG